MKRLRNSKLTKEHLFCSMSEQKASKLLNGCSRLLLTKLLNRLRRFAVFVKPLRLRGFKKLTFVLKITVRPNGGFFHAL